eukprot:CAMPEP_0119547954 /NCGR_PEP_ID=MMETSP1352-20130426/1974_1 /TAXON_ID=265584 /ORGANISM="Stauroneis constricta, Strain CCMP1120" /LENGTH=442 /DNA_ID=CAMNT_0007593067 /DNA_START=105 /DNA_END=1433 /DNA_ORIENTATION=-
MCKPNETKAAIFSETKLNEADAELMKEKHNEWIKNFDYDGFYQEIRALGKKLEDAQGPEDVAHLNRMVMWSNMCAAFGLVSMGFAVNIFSIVGISLYIFSRWTMIAHHTCHGGYEKCHPERKGRWSRFKFALSTLWRRWNDWFDWMMPEAWNIEHNTRHHYNLSEVHDPDLVEHNMHSLREQKGPHFLKYFNVVFLMATWKWFYYAPNTYKELKLAKMRREGKPIPKGIKPEAPITFKDIFTQDNVFYTGWEFLAVVFGPYLLIHFFLTPIPFYFLGEQLGDYGYTGAMMYKNAVWNLFFAEILTNFHAFLAITTNHAGDDMYRFEQPCRPYSGSFFLRQVLASVDFSMGTDLIDFMHGWLNYQIEHHMWPNLSMLSYQRSAPLVKEICNKYGVPYVQENVFLRLKKTVDIMVGNTSMRRFPEAVETAYLRRDAEIEAEKNK